MSKKKSTKISKAKGGIDNKSVYPQLSTTEESKTNNSNTNQRTGNEWDIINQNDPNALLGVHDPEDSIHRPLVFQNEEEGK